MQTEQPHKTLRCKKCNKSHKTQRPLLLKTKPTEKTENLKRPKQTRVPHFLGLHKKLIFMTLSLKLKA